MTNQLEPTGHFNSASSSSPAWRWRLEDSSGAEVSGVDSPEFTSQGDAESWVGEAWRELLESGVDKVTLFEGDREVYGPMSLHPS